MLLQSRDSESGAPEIENTGTYRPNAIDDRGYRIHELQQLRMQLARPRRSACLVEWGSLRLEPRAFTYPVTLTTILKAPWSRATAINTPMGITSAPTWCCTARSWLGLSLKRSLSSTFRLKYIFSLTLQHISQLRVAEHPPNHVTVTSE